VLTLPVPLRLLCAIDTRALSEILRIVYRCLSSHLIARAQLDQYSARTGAVTFIQRFGGSVNLHLHFHILALDGVYRVDPSAKTLLHFRPAHPPRRSLSSSSSASAGASNAWAISRATPPTFARRRHGMTWAVRRRRVFNIDVSRCERCGGTARIIACIENPEMVRRILTHLAARDSSELSGVGGMCVYTNYAPLAVQGKIVP
jgi:Putative transposase